METFKVIIDNWQNKDWIETWLPIFIAGIALITSVISILLTKNQFRRSSRPYVCAFSYSQLNQGNIIPQPSLVGYRVLNSPAKIHISKVVILLGDKVLFENEILNQVKYNASDTEWNFDIGLDNLTPILNQHSNTQGLLRKITIKYSSLDGGKKYNYKAIQSFDSSRGQWLDQEVEGD